MAIVGAAHAWLYYRDVQDRELRTSQLETLLAQTRLQMLGMQLQPHFLFNTLNTIAELVHERPEAAERMIAGLSHLLRETLHAGLVERVPIERELSLLERYIDIQRARFGDREDSSGRCRGRRKILQRSRGSPTKEGSGGRRERRDSGGTGAELELQHRFAFILSGLRSGRAAGPHLYRGRVQRGGSHRRWAYGAIPVGQP